MLVYELTILQVSKNNKMTNQYHSDLKIIYWPTYTEVKANKISVNIFSHDKELCEPM